MKYEIHTPSHITHAFITLSVRQKRCVFVEAKKQQILIIMTFAKWKLFYFTSQA